MNQRANRMASIIKRLAAENLRYPQDPANLISITDVKVSDDLRYATVWVSLSKPLADESEAWLSEQRGRLLTILASRATTKFVPKLRVEIDNSAQHTQRIDKLLGKLKT